MFPELEGYTSAVPSKRDLLSFVKAVQEELVDAASESDTGLIRFVCREIAKAVQLLVSKIEGMVQTTPETGKMDPAKKFARTSSQDHNHQLMVLVTQLRDAVEKLPSQVVKLLDESSVSVDDEARLEGIRSAVASFTAVSVERIDSLAGRVLMAPLVDSLAHHFKGVLLGLYREGGTVAPASAASMSPTADFNASDCSKTVQQLLRQFPEAAEVHLLSLPKHPAVTWALEEACRRLLVMYVSVVVLLRPVTEMSRLRAAADMTALELMVSGLHSRVAPQAASGQRSDSPLDPVRAEVKALRRLLFEERAVPSAPAAAAPARQSGAAPVAEAILSLPFLSSMRPSTLLGYLMSCGPTQVVSLLL